MITPFENLSGKDQAILLDAPLWVAMWVGLADNHFDQNEQIKAVKTLAIKTFSETPDVALLYQKIENPSERLLQLLDTLPADADGKKSIVRDKLIEVTAALKNCDEIYANELYLSFRNVGVHVANASGGMLGLGSIDEEEKVALSLDFMKP